MNQSTSNLPTPAKFRQQAERAIRSNHPDTDIDFRWERVSPVCDYRVGNGQFRTGTVVVTAEGFRPRRMIASIGTLEGLSVR